jgi:alpha-maltose-1-phosphate synthase
VSNSFTESITARVTENISSEEKCVDTDRSSGKPSVLLSRTTANQNTRNALRSLVEHEMLAEFWTTFAWDPQSFWNSPLPRRVRTQLARRSIDEAPAYQVRTVPWREAVRLALHGTPLESFLCSGERPFSVIAMSQNFDARVARRFREIRPDIVYAYDGAALETFRESRKHGITTIEEQCSSYWRWARDFFAEEAERTPEFASLLPTLTDPPGHLERKDEELQLADYVFVASKHVQRTLAGVVPDAKVRMIPYAAPAVKPRQHFNRESGAPLKVLFVGNLGQHKGIGYLLAAMDLLGGKAELTMVGRRLRANARVDAACRRWRWFETLPQARVLDLMQESDVLVLPSLSDAFGLVVTEGLACGLPVIVTPNTGASEIIRDGREGYVVPICRADIIACRLEALYSDREMLAEMSRQAQDTAAKNSWERYRANWARMIRSLE